MSGHRLSGMCVATHSPVPPSGEASHLSGIAVHPLGTVLMLCSNNGRSLHCLHTFSLPSCSPIASFAGKGTRPGDVYCPRKIGYSPDGNTVFVAEDRVSSPVVQELSSSNGDHLRFIGEGQIYRGLSGLAVGEHLIAVGRWSSDSDAVVLFERSSGAFLRSFGGCGLTPGMMRSVTGIRFTQDGSHIVAAEYLNCRASVFNVSGVFVKCVGKGTATTPFDVEICPNGDVIVPDVGKVSTRVRVCDDGTEPVLSLSPTGASGKGFPAPVTALAYHNDTATLYVLDERGAVYVYQ